MFNFKRKLTKNEKLDFLEYLAFQVKSDMSFEKALVRYNSNQNRKKHILETCNNTIQDIRNGKTPADALFDNELIERLEYGIVKNGRSNKELYESLTSIININKGNINNSNELQKAVRSGVLLITFVFLLIPLFKNELIALYGTFEQMQAMTGKKNVVIELPFLIKYWWASFVIIGLIGAVAYGGYLYYTLNKGVNSSFSDLKLVCPIVNFCVKCTINPSILLVNTPTSKVFERC